MHDALIAITTQLPAGEVESLETALTVPSRVAGAAFRQPFRYAP
jgi:hypothetical protein